MTTTSAERQDIFISSGARNEAETLAGRLDDGGRLSLTTTGEQHALPRELASVLEDAVRLLARGQTVVVTSRPRELTTTAAAAMIGVSRPTLMKLIKDGELAAHKVGTHTRVLSEDVDRFRAKRREEQLAAFEALRELEARGMTP